jgi:signal transduction histidine kinase
MHSLRSQLVLSHLLLVLLMGLVMSAASVGFFSVIRSIDKVLKGNFATIQAAHEMTDGIHEQETAYALYATGDIADARTTFLRASAVFRRAYQDALHTVTTADEKKFLSEIGRDYARVNPIGDQLFGRSDLANHPRTLATFQTFIRPELRRISALTEDLLAASRQAIVDDNDSAMSTAQNSYLKSAMFAIIATIAAVLIASSMIHVILTPLRTLKKHAERISEGDLSPNDLKPRDDEIGALSDTFNQMASKLAEVREDEARKIRRLERISETALESMYDPVIVTDANRLIVRLNKAAEKLFGPVPESPRKPVAEHIHNPRILKAIENAISADQVLAVEDESAQIQLHVGDVQKTYRLRVTPMKGDDDRLVGSVTVLEDITHQKVVDQMKNEFIAVASHDLRSPVTSLILANHLLRDGVAGPLTPEQSEVVETQHEDLERLERLMRDLLDVSKLEAGASPPHFERMSVDRLTTHSVEHLKIQAEKKGVVLSLDIAEGIAEVNADPLQIGRVLTNLIANAIRHTPPGGAVTLRARQSGNVVILSVEDTGEGIPEEYRKRIFDRFVQVPGTTQGGAGLGLSIAQKIAQAHGGEMSVESQVGKGSTFSFTLPTAIVSRGGDIKV